MDFDIVKAVKCIPVFDGSHEHLQVFIDMVDIFAPRGAAGEAPDDAANQMNANQEQNRHETQLLAVVRMKMKGKALDQINQIMKPTWVGTKEALREVFEQRISMERLSIMISSLVQGKHESLTDYKTRADKIRSYINLLGDNEFANRQLKFNFVTGLQLDSMRQFAASLDTRTYADLARQLAIKGEYMEEVTNSWECKNQNNLKSTSSKGSHNVSSNNSGSNNFQSNCENFNQNQSNSLYPNNNSEHRNVNLNCQQSHSQFPNNSNNNNNSQPNHTFMIEDCVEEETPNYMQSENCPLFTTGSVPQISLQVNANHSNDNQQTQNHCFLSGDFMPSETTSSVEDEMPHYMRVENCAFLTTSGNCENSKQIEIECDIRGSENIVADYMSRVMPPEPEKIKRAATTRTQKRKKEEQNQLNNDALLSDKENEETDKIGTTLEINDSGGCSEKLINEELNELPKTSRNEGSKMCVKGLKSYDLYSSFEYVDASYDPLEVKRDRSELITNKRECDARFFIANSKNLHSELSPICNLPHGSRQFAREAHEVKTILREFHDAPLGGHIGAKRRRKRVGLVFNWKNRKRDIEHYVRKCDVYQRNKIRRSNILPFAPY